MRFNTDEEFRAAIIAQADSGGYDPGGYVAVVRGQEAALANFSHCSCYGTWTAINGGGILSSGSTSGPQSWSWTGTRRQLVALAKKKGDPHLKRREADPKDFDYGHLLAVYSKILAWAARPKKGVASHDVKSRAGATQADAPTR